MRISKPGATKYKAWKTTTKRMFKAKVKEGKDYRFQVAAEGAGGRGPVATIRFKASDRQNAPAHLVARRTDKPRQSVTIQDDSLRTATGEPSRAWNGSRGRTAKTAFDAEGVSRSRPSGIEVTPSSASGQAVNG